MIKTRLFKTGLQISAVTIASVILSACNEKKKNAETTSNVDTGAQVAMSADERAYQERKDEKASQLELLKIQSQERQAMAQAQATKDQFNEQGTNNVEVARIQTNGQITMSENSANAQKTSALYGTLGTIGAPIAGGYFSMSGQKAMAEAEKESASASSKNMLDMERVRQQGAVAVAQVNADSRKDADSLRKEGAAIRGQIQDAEKLKGMAAARNRAINAVLQGQPMPSDEAAGQEYAKILDGREPKDLSKDEKGRLKAEAGRMNANIATLNSKIDGLHNQLDIKQTLSGDRPPVDPEMEKIANSMGATLRSTSKPVDTNPRPTAHANPMGSAAGDVSQTSMTDADIVRKFAEQAEKDNLLGKNGDKYSTQLSDPQAIIESGKRAGLTAEQSAAAAAAIDGKTKEDVRKAEAGEYSGFFSSADTVSNFGGLAWNASSGSESIPVSSGTTTGFGNFDPSKKSKIPGTPDKQDTATEIAKNDKTSKDLTDSSQQADRVDVTTKQTVESYYAQIHDIAKEREKIKDDPEALRVLQAKADSLSSDMNLKFKNGSVDGQQSERASQLAEYNKNLQEALQSAVSSPDDFFKVYGQSGSYFASNSSSTNAGSVVSGFDQSMGSSSSGLYAANGSSQVFSSDFHGGSTTTNSDGSARCLYGQGC